MIRLVSTLAVLSMLTVVGPAQAATDGESRAIVSLAPGHDSTWEMRAQNTHGADAEIAVDISAVTGEIFDGSAPASLAVEQDGAIVASSHEGAGLEGTHLELGTLAAGEEVVLTGRAALPPEAGDEYRDVSGVVVWRFTLLVDDTVAAPPSPPISGLPVTGATALVALGVLALATVLAGGALLARRQGGGAP